MPSADLHQKLVLLELALGLVTFAALLFVAAPYGRHARPGWGPRIPARLAWIVMETPALLGFLGIYLLGRHRFEPAPLALAGLWTLHYGHRVLVFPLRMRPGARTMPALVVALAIAFNVLNASVNAPQIAELGHYEPSWLADPRFLVGSALFFAGFAQNLRADDVLRRLRRPGETTYGVPSGALHELVANPNYLGEILEWAGWAIATWSLAGLSFALYTAANLVPRALSNLKWYRATFPDYPKERRAVFPWLL